MARWSIEDESVEKI